MTMAGENFTQGLAEREIGNTVSIEKVDGGFILRWKEAIVLPEAKRKEYGPLFETVNKTAVRATVDAALELAREIMSSQKVTGSKWGQ